MRPREFAFWAKSLRGQKANAYLLYSRQEQKTFGHVSHSTELVRMCLACQHFDFNSADWISDNLHVISSRYLRTMGKEFIFVGQERVTNPSERLRGRLAVVTYFPYGDCGKGGKSL